MTVLVCGEALYDVFFEGERQEGFTLDARIGGSAFNVAMGLGRLGARTGLLTGISSDRLGDKLVARLADEGVDTGFIARKNATTTLAMVSLAADGSAHYQFYGEGAADRAVTLDDLPDPGSVSAAVFGCFSILTQPTGDTFLAFAERVAGSGGLVALDPNIRPTVEPDLGVWRQRVAGFAKFADLIKVSAEDLAHLFPGESLADISGRWMADGVAAVVVTRGPDGAVMVRGGDSIAVAAPSTEVIDTVGAGDSFLAALMAELTEMGAATHDGLNALSEPEIRKILAFAAQAAAVTCARRGADLPRRGEVPVSP